MGFATAVVKVRGSYKEKFSPVNNSKIFSDYSKLINCYLLYNIILIKNNF